MSAPLTVSGEEWIKFGEFLLSLSRATKTLGCTVGVYGSVDVSVNGDCSLRIRWDNDRAAYVVDDRAGD